MASTKSENDESTAREDEDRAEEDSEESTASEDQDEGSDGEGSDEGSDEESSDDEDSEDSDGESSDDESSDDDGSEDDGSDDERSDDEGESRDEGADEEGASAGGAADAEAPAATPKKKSGKGARQFKKDGMTAGARLAAAKAAKAARKAAKLGKEKKDQDPMAQVRENPLVQRVEQASSWAQQNRTMVWALVAALVLGVGGWLGYNHYADQQARAAAALLEDALEIADAQIVSEDATDEDRDEDDPPTFTSEQARAEAALEAFQAVIAQHPGSTAATWARLGEARALFDLGRNDDARQSYERAAEEGGADPAIVWRALEGKGFTLEADEQWAQALEVYEQLASLDEGRFEPVAKYHMARMYLAQGERERATETLSTLVTSLREAEDDEDAQDFGYVLAQAQTRLRELDPSAAPPPPSPSLDSPFGGGPGGPGDQLTPEQIQELIRRFQQQGGGAGGTPGGE